MVQIPTNVEDGYTPLYEVLEKALQQAQAGKGADRHTPPGEQIDFDDQQICSIPRMQGSVDGPIFQAVKKCLEIKNITGTEAQVRELLGAINYIAAAVILLEENAKKEEHIPTA